MLCPVPAAWHRNAKLTADLAERDARDRVAPGDLRRWLTPDLFVEHLAAVDDRARSHRPGLRSALVENGDLIDCVTRLNTSRRASREGALYRAVISLVTCPKIDRIVSAGATCKASVFNVRRNPCG